MIFRWVLVVAVVGGCGAERGRTGTLTPLDTRLAKARTDNTATAWGELLVNAVYQQNETLAKLATTNLVDVKIAEARAAANSHDHVKALRALNEASGVGGQHEEQLTAVKVEVLAAATAELSAKLATPSTATFDSVHAETQILVALAALPDTHPAIVALVELRKTAVDDEIAKAAHMHAYNLATRFHLARALHYGADAAAIEKLMPAEQPIVPSAIETPSRAISVAPKETLGYTTSATGSSCPGLASIARSGAGRGGAHSASIDVEVIRCDAPVESRTTGSHDTIVKVIRHRPKYTKKYENVQVEDGSQTVQEERCKRPSPGDKGGCSIVTVQRPTKTWTTREITVEDGTEDYEDTAQGSIPTTRVARSAVIVGNVIVHIDARTITHGFSGRAADRGESWEGHPMSSLKSDRTLSEEAARDAQASVIQAIEEALAGPDAKLEAEYRGRLEVAEAADRAEAEKRLAAAIEVEHRDPDAADELHLRHLKMGRRSGIELEHSEAWLKGRWGWIDPPRVAAAELTARFELPQAERYGEGPREKRLPPIDLGFATSADGTNREYGFRLGTNLIVPTDDNESPVVLVAKAQLGYDTLAKVMYDVEGRAWLRKAVFGVVLVAGRDQFGVGVDMPLVPGGFYGGFGIGAFLGPHFNQYGSFSFSHVWRVGDNVSSAGDQASGEWRFSGEIQIRKGPLAGAMFDYRDLGRVSTGVLGLRFWL